MQRLAAEAHAKTMQLMPPPIPFENSKKKGRNEDGRSKSKDKDSTKYVTFDCRIDPKDKNSEKVSR